MASQVDIKPSEHSEMKSSVSGGQASGFSGTAGTTSANSTMSVVGDTASKSSKISFNFMCKRQTYRVIENDEDVTPENIVVSDYITMEDHFTHAAFEDRQPFKSEVGLKKSVTRRSSTDAGEGMKVFATNINLDDIRIDHTMNTEEGLVYDDPDLEVAPSAYCLPKVYPPMSYPQEIFVVLKETDTIFLFDLPSNSYEKGTDEATKVEEDNEYYQYITVGKGRNRKTVVEETQTKSTVTQTRHTLATRPEKRNAISFASLWDMHDTYAKLAQEQPEEEEDEMVLYQSVPPEFLRKRKINTGDDRASKTFECIGSTPQFADAVMLTERVPASKIYDVQQKKFRGIFKMDPLSLDLIYVYSMKPLWTFDYEELQNKPVSSISFNPMNPDILAIGHGKFSYTGNYYGIVCIWCTKNPSEPERLYRFDVPVTSLAFSEKKPNWLACGFSNGDVLILDITSYTVQTIAKSKRETNPSFEPIWSINWREIEYETAYVMTTCQDGRINRFTRTKTHDFICTPMMRICTVEGKMKGLEAPKPCLKSDVPVTRYPAAICMKWHPTIDHIYYVGTDEGCIHRCSKHYLNQHMDVYKAHIGPIYDLIISPFMNNLLVTCGADSAIRMWMEGMDEVILTLNCQTAVYGVSFCPTNATVLISISGNILAIWDLRRKTHMPCAEYNFQPSVVLTYVTFSASGDNVFVGDTSGKVYTFHLEDTPIPAYSQRKLLEDVLTKALCTRPHLLKQIEKLKKRSSV